MIAPERRCFRFSLRTMFVVLTVFFSWLGWEMNSIHRRRAAIERLTPLAARFVSLESEQKKGPGQKWLLPYDHVRQVPFWRRMLGDEAIGWIYLDATSPPEDYELTKKLFPEALVYQHGNGYDSTDEAEFARYRSTNPFDANKAIAEYRQAIAGDVDDWEDQPKLSARAVLLRKEWQQKRGNDSIRQKAFGPAE